MKNVLYIGNNLEGSNHNPSYISVLGPLLEQEGYSLRYASSKTHKIGRLLDMLYTVFVCRNTTAYVLIDTYSTLNFYYAYAVSVLCSVFKLKYVPLLHGGNLPNRLLKKPLLSRMIFNHAYLNVAPSFYLYHNFKNHGIDNIRFIPNVITIEDYPYKERTYKRVKLLWVRAFAAIYNPTMAVKVLSSLQQNGIDAELCMVGPDKGDGSLQATKALAKSLGVTVTFTGKLSKPEWIDLANQYNIFINTTNFDNTPVSVIEAMALGLPVVSTKVGGIPYLIDDTETGLLVPPDETQAMTTAITKLYHNPEEALKLAKAARNKVEQYDWDIVFKQWEQVLKGAK